VSDDLNLRRARFLGLARGLERDGEKPFCAFLGDYQEIRRRNRSKRKYGKKALHAGPELANSRHQHWTRLTVPLSLVAQAEECLKSFSNMLCSYRNVGSLALVEHPAWYCRYLFVTRRRVGGKLLGHQASTPFSKSI